MRSVQNSCTLHPNALEIHVGNQIEQLDQIIRDTNGDEYFKKTFITDGMRSLLTHGISRLASKTNHTIFHLKQAMGGGKTHLMVGFGLLAKDPGLRNRLIPDIQYQNHFGTARIIAFNGRNHPNNYFWGEISKQLGKESSFREYWENGVRAPDEQAWIRLFEGSEPILILLDEMPPYFHYYSTQVLGAGTIADVVTTAFSNMLTAAQRKNNLCIVISDLDAAYDVGSNLIQRALNDAKQELGRAEFNITPVNLESNEIYEILRKRLFNQLPTSEEISEIANVYASRLTEASRAGTIERSAEAIANEIESTYPFHPSFKSIVALFKENEKFKQTRGLMELVSRLLKSVWENADEIYLIGAQHFDLSILEVREKLAEISNMRDVIAKDLWEITKSAHAQMIDIQRKNDCAKQVGTLLLTASLSTAVHSIKGLTTSEMYTYLIDPHRSVSDYRSSFEELVKSAWYLHQTQEGRNYFAHQENLTKKLKGYADRAPDDKINHLIKEKLIEMYTPVTKDAYEKVLPLPNVLEAEASLKAFRTLLIINPESQSISDINDTDENIIHFFNRLVQKNNFLILTGSKSSMASLKKVARYVYAITLAHPEILDKHPQRKELDDKIIQYRQDFQSTILATFDKILFPSYSNTDILRDKVIDHQYSNLEKYQGEEQIIKTLTSDPIKLYRSVESNFDILRIRASSLLFGEQNDVRKTDILDKMKSTPRMPWMPFKGIDHLIAIALQRGVWEDLGNGLLTKSPRPKTTDVIIQEEILQGDEGYVQLKIDTVYASDTPKVYYQEDGEVSESSLLLTGFILRTKALRVQFLAIDPTGQNLKGVPKKWENKLVIRNHFDQVSRIVKLFVAPQANLKYTIDGSNPRYGIPYEHPIQLNENETDIQIFAEIDGLEAQKTFKFPSVNVQSIEIDNDKPASLNTNSSKAPKRLDQPQKIYEAIEIAKEKKIEFEQVSLIIGSAPKVAHLTFGEIKITGEFIEKQISHVQDFFNQLTNIPNQINLILTFRKVHTKTGFDLKQFAEKVGIEILFEEVEQQR